MSVLQAWGATHPGTVRAVNEDSLLTLPGHGLFAVADGAGGHSAGDVASGRLCQALGALPGGLGPDEMLHEIRQAVRAVHAGLRQEAARRGDAVIASTLVVLLLGKTHFAALWSGDSRIYLARAGVLAQITRDHSLVQDLVEAGALSASDAEHHPQANIITRAIGAPDDSGELDKKTGEALAGDCFLLCSDGLTKTLADAAILALLAAPDPAAALLEAALAAGARDNVTAVVIRLGDGTAADT